MVRIQSSSIQTSWLLNISGVLESITKKVISIKVQAYFEKIVVDGHMLKIGLSFPRGIPVFWGTKLS